MIGPSLSASSDGEPPIISRRFRAEVRGLHDVGDLGQELESRTTTPACTTE